MSIYSLKFKWMCGIIFYSRLMAVGKVDGISKHMNNQMFQDKNKAVTSFLHSDKFYLF